MFQLLLPLPLSCTTTRSCFQQTQPTVHTSIYTHLSTQFNQEGPHNTLQIKGAPVSHQEARSYKSHFICLHLLAKLLRTLLREGGLRSSCPTSLQFPSGEPNPVWSLLPSLHTPSDKTPSREHRLDRRGVLQCLAHPREEWHFPAAPCPMVGARSPMPAGGLRAAQPNAAQQLLQCPHCTHFKINTHPPTHPLQSPVTRWPSRALSRRIKAVHEGKNVYF